MNSARVYLCAGNAEERFLNIALEKLLFEMKTGGQLPLLVYMGNPPFTTGSVKTKQREDTFPYFDYDTGAEIPSVQFSNLLNLLSETRKKRALMAEVLFELKKLQVVTLNNGRVYLTELSKKQKMLIEKFRHLCQVFSQSIEKGYQ